MQDKQLFQNIISVLQTGLTAYGYDDVQIRQSFQPINVGANTAPTLYIHKISDHRYGFPERKDTIESDLSLQHSETQLYESMFQITALSIQDPANTAQKTASDIANMAAAIMQSDATNATLLANSISIYRITDVRNPYFVDDKDRFEASPSFDFTLQHEQVIISTTPAVEKFEFNMDAV